MMLLQFSLKNPGPWRSSARISEIRQLLGRNRTETTEVTERVAMQFKASCDPDMRVPYREFMSFMAAEFDQELRKFVTGGRESMDVQISKLS
jgi:hypothetical protein